MSEGNDDSQGLIEDNEIPTLGENNGLTDESIQTIPPATDDTEEDNVPPAPQPRRVAAEKDANVALGREGLAIAEGPLNMGTMPEPIIIPDEAQQRAGFKVEAHQVGPLIAQFPQFKNFTDKGE